MSRKEPAVDASQKMKRVRRSPENVAAITLPKTISINAKYLSEKRFSSQG